MLERVGARKTGHVMRQLILVDHAADPVTPLLLGCGAGTAVIAPW